MAINLGGALGQAGDWFNEQFVHQKKKPAVFTPALDPQTGAPRSELTNLEMGPPGGKTPLIPQVTDPYLEQAKAAASGISGMLPQYQSLYGTGAGAMTGLIGDLQKQARGEAGPGQSLAQALLQQGLTQNVGAVQSQLASQRGLSAAQRGRLASRQIAALQGQTAQQAGLMGLQQQLAAQDALAKLGTGAAQLGSDLQLRGAGLLTGQSTEQARIAAGIAQANQAAQAADKARTTQLGTSILGGASQVGAAAVGAAHGGRIDGEAPYPGDTPKNDVVPANLSPGEIVIPRSAAGSKKAAKAFIEALDDWDEEPSYGKVLKARQKKNYADGGKVDFPLGGPYAPVSPERMSAAYDQEIPVAQKMKQSFDQFLTERVVDPLAQRGYPTLGAALATVPSVAADVMIPSTTGELQAGVIPFPKGKAGKKVADKAKELSDELPANIKRFFNFNESVEEKMYRKAKEKPMSETAKKMSKEELAALSPEEKAYEGVPLTRGEKILLEPNLQSRSEYLAEKSEMAQYDRDWRKLLESRKGKNAVFPSELGEGTSLDKGGWFDAIGGNLKPLLDDIKELNKGNKSLVSRIDEYKKLDQLAKTEKLPESAIRNRDKVYDSIIDLIDSNLDLTLLPKLTKVK